MQHREVAVEIKEFVWDVVDSNSWLVTENDDLGRHGLLIDAVDNDALCEELKSLVSLIIILTHSHFDHIIGLNRIRDCRPDANVIATSLCSEYIGNKYKNMTSSATAFMVFYSGRNDIAVEPFTCVPANETFEDKYEFKWCEHHIRLEAFHGHSADSLIAIIDDDTMFSGDTLLSIPTVTRFPGGSTTRFWNEDIPRLIAMNNICKVYPGHKEAGLLENMIAINKRPDKIK